MDLCRTCMNSRGSEVVGSDFCTIFSTIEVEDINVYIADSLAQWIGRTVDPNDGMPTEICKPCLEAIKSITLFIENAKYCDSNLRQMLQIDSKGSLQDIESGDEIVVKEEMQYFDTLSDEEQTNDSNYEQQSNGQTDTDDGSRCKRVQKRRKISSKGRRKTVNIKEEVEQEISNASSEDQHSEGISDTDADHVQRRQRKTNKQMLSRGKKSRDARNPNKSFNVINVENNVICCGCFLLFDNEKELQQHGKNVHKLNKMRNNPVNTVKKQVCQVCFRRFEEVSQLHAHRERHQSVDKIYECNKCYKRFSNADTIQKHMEKHPNTDIGPPKLYPVPITRLEKDGYLCCVRNCYTSHDSEDALFEHVAKDHNLNDSIDAKHTTSEFQCPFCRRTYESKEKLYSHYMNKYTSLRSVARHQCDECGKIYKSLASLTAHANKHAEIKPYQCDTCLKCFYSQAVLKQHKLIHTQGKQLVCTICGRAFRTKLFLENHYRIHSDEKPFTCDICHKSFRHTSSLCVHKRTHDIEKQHKCVECGKGFTDTANLNRHMVSHTGIKPYQCHYCEKGFMRLAERSDHESIVHMGIMPYSCEICGKDFSSKRNFVKHETMCTGDNCT